MRWRAAKKLLTHSPPNWSEWSLKLRTRLFTFLRLLTAKTSLLTFVLSCCARCLADGHAVILTVSTVDPCITSNFTFRANLTFLGSPAGYEAPNEQACVNNCAADYFCVGVDVDYQSNPVLCWPHTNRNDYNIIYSQPGTNSYERIFECPGRFFSFFQISVRGLSTYWFTA